MKDVEIVTERLILRRFEPRDVEAVYLLFSDKEVNTFLPWYPLDDMKEAEEFYRTRLNGRYCLAICLKEDGFPIGYIHADEGDSHDFGYALRREYWHRGITSEAAAAFVSFLKEEGFPYITATHDVNNPRSGAVMKRIGMKYCYSYVEQWQPKNFPVTFRMYQLNLDGEGGRVYRKYRDMYPNFTETV